jgi:endo-beta-N-acetylglucosaminidase D
MWNSISKSFNKFVDYTFTFWSYQDLIILNSGLENHGFFLNTQRTSCVVDKGHSGLIKVVVKWSIIKSSLSRCVVLGKQ